MTPSRPATLGALRATGYRSRPVKQEMRENLIARLRSGDPLFPGIVGYEDSVVPALSNAILGRHNFILLGLRGQAKSRILRQLVRLLRAEFLRDINSYAVTQGRPLLAAEMERELLLRL